MGFNWKQEWKPLLLLLGGFLICFYLPVENIGGNHAVREGLQLVRWYAREHVIFCLLPAFFIAGAIGAFVNHASPFDSLCEPFSRPN